MSVSHINSPGDGEILNQDLPIQNSQTVENDELCGKLNTHA